MRVFLQIVLSGIFKVSFITLEVLGLIHGNSLLRLAVLRLEIRAFFSIYTFTPFIEHEVYIAPAETINFILKRLIRKIVVSFTEIQTRFVHKVSYVGCEIDLEINTSNYSAMVG